MELSGDNRDNVFPVLHVALAFIIHTGANNSSIGTQPNRMLVSTGNIDDICPAADIVLVCPGLPFCFDCFILENNKSRAIRSVSCNNICLLSDIRATIFRISGSNNSPIVL